MASRLTIRAKWSARRTQLHPDHKKTRPRTSTKTPKQTHIFLLLLEIQERKLPPKTKNLAVPNPIEATRDKSPFCDWLARASGPVKSSLLIRGHKAHKPPPQKKSVHHHFSSFLRRENLKKKQIPVGRRPNRVVATNHHPPPPLPLYPINKRKENKCLSLSPISIGSYGYINVLYIYRFCTSTPWGHPAHRIWPIMIFSRPLERNLKIKKNLPFLKKKRKKWFVSKSVQRGGCCCVKYHIVLF